MSRLKFINGRPHYLIFRRFRKTKSGQVLDAYDYGLRAWPIWLPA